MGDFLISDHRQDGDVLYVCMYVCMVISYSKSKDVPGKVANVLLVRGQLHREN